MDSERRREKLASERATRLMLQARKARERLVRGDRKARLRTLPLRRTRPQ